MEKAVSTLDPAEEGEDGKETSFKTVGFRADAPSLAQWWLLIPRDSSRWGSVIDPADDVRLFNLHSQEYCMVNTSGSALLSNKSPQKDRSSWRLSCKKDSNARNTGELSLKNKSLSTQGYINMTPAATPDAQPTVSLSATEQSFSLVSLRPYESLITYGSSINLEYCERAGWTVATDQKMALSNPAEMNAFMTTNAQESTTNKWYIRYAQGESSVSRAKWPVLLGDTVRFEFAGTKIEPTQSTDSLFLFSRFGLPSSPTTSQQRILTFKGDGLGCNWIVSSPTGNQNKAVVATSSMINDETNNTSPLTTKIWIIHQVTGQGLHGHHDDTHKFNNDSTKREVTGFETIQGNLGTWQVRTSQ